MNEILEKPEKGSVYKANCGAYRMYIEIEGKSTLLCINLSEGYAYPNTKDNGLTNPAFETFVFNMADVVTSNTTEGT
jgi:hypothetical protein